MRIYRSLSPQHCTEAPRIAQADQAVAEHEIEVIVLLGRRAPWKNPQASGHSKVQDQMSIAQIDEKIFSAPTHRLHFSSGELSHCARYWPTQPWLTNRDSGNHAAFQVWQKTAARDIYFCEFGHDNSGGTAA